MLKLARLGKKGRLKLNIEKNIIGKSPDIPEIYGLVFRCCAKVHVIYSI